MSDVVAFERVKKINLSGKYTVFGYIRKCQCILPSNIAYYQIPELVQHIILLFYYNTIDSKILTDAECDKLLSLFTQQNKFNHLDNYSYHLIYSSDNDGIGENIFKTKCHNQMNILCLIESINGNVFGGYTCSGWIGIERKDEGHYDEKAFIFSIRSNNGYSSAIFNYTKGYALWNQSNYYCIFGGAVAFYINCDGKTGACNDKKCANFETYPNDYYLTGHCLFDVKTVEVFQLKQ